MILLCCELNRITEDKHKTRLQGKDHFYGFVILTGLTFFLGGGRGVGGGGQKLLSENVKQNYFVFYIAVFFNDFEHIPVNSQNT